MTVCFISWINFRIFLSEYSDILRTIHTSEDTGVYDKIVNSIFNEESLSSNEHERGGRLRLVGGDTSSIMLTDVDTSYRDQVIEVAARVFRQHCAKRLENIAMRMSGDCFQLDRSPFVCNALLLFLSSLIVLSFDLILFLNLKEYCETFDTRRGHDWALPWAALAICEMGHGKSGIQFFFLSLSLQ